MRIHIFSILFIFIGLQCWGQNNIEVYTSYGKILKQNTDISFDTNQPVIGFSGAYTFQTTGKKKWHRLRNFPEVNINFVYFNLGNKDVLGHAFGIFPSLTLDIIKKEKYTLSGRFGWGIGYISKKYDRQDNPTNNAIGSKLNILPGFHITNRYQIKPRLSLFQSFSLTHFSNASYQKPNLGINVISLNLGVQYNIKKALNIPGLQNKAIIDTEKPLKRKLFVGAQYGIGFTEMGTTNGPKHLIQFSSLYLQYAFKKHLLNGGLDLETNHGIAAFAKHTQQYETNSEIRRASRRQAVFLADEIMFGRFGVWLQWGLYINKKNSFLLGGNHYFKLGSRYHFPFGKKKQHDVHIGFYMKSHKIIAEYFSLAIGVKI